MKKIKIQNQWVGFRLFFPNHIEEKLSNFPPFKKYFKNRRFQNHFRNELSLINGNHVSTSSHASIIHFSLNKAATQYVKSILTTCSSVNGLVPIGIHDYAVRSDFPYLDKLSVVEMKQYQHIFRSKGYLYSVFGGMISNLPEISRYKIVLVIRDPRDILVSEFFSMAYSHKVPDGRSDKRNGFLDKRNEASNSTIDEYVLKHSDRLMNTFNRYNKELLNRDLDVFVTKYEEMIVDFKSWLDGLLRYCQLEIDQQLVTAFIKEHEHTIPHKEDTSKHIRKGQAGDYNVKLQTETILILNEKFADILSQFNYEK